MDDQGRLSCENGDRQTTRVEKWRKIKAIGKGEGIG